MQHHQDVTRYAEAVADGVPPDGAADDSRLTPEDRDVLANLRALASIADLFATVTGGHRGREDRPALPPLPPGAEWGGLRVIEAIGRGRFGQVYRAWDPALAREVALKLMAHRDGDDAQGSQLVEEGRLMARVRHPNVVSIYGARRLDGTTGLWMELVDGRTLAAELEDRGPFDAKELTAVGIELCRALQAVHGAGLVHRDVKAQNVLRDRSGRIALGDFGTGGELDQDTEAPSGLAGTPAYLAPETFDRRPATPRSDVYSLGVLLFLLATRRYPVEGRSLRTFREAHARGTRTSLRALRPDLPARLCAAVDTALSIDPEARFQAADDLRAALEHCQRSSSVFGARAAVAGAVALTGIAGLSVLLGLQWFAGSRVPVLHAGRVVVAPFENRTGDPAHDPLGGVAAEWITRDLQHAGIAEVVPADVAHASTGYIRSAAGDTPGRDVIRALAEETGSGLVVSGASYVRGGSLQVQAAITDARQGKTLVLEPAGAAMDDPTAAVERLGQRTLAGLAQILEVRLPPDMRFRERPSLNYEAYLARVASWEAEARNDFDAAFAHSERARALEPTDLNAVLRSASLRIRRRVDMSPHDRAESDSLLDLLDRSREQLAAPDRALLDFLIARQGRDRVREYETAKLWGMLSPGATDASSNWALKALQAANRPREAIRILSDIDPRRFAQGHFHAADYWITLMDAHHVLGDHREEVKAARRALALYPDHPAVLQWAAFAFAAGGHVAEARASVDARLALPPDWFPGPLRVMSSVGRELDVHGHEEAAREMAERTIAWYAGRPVAERVVSHPHYTLAYYGMALNTLGRLDQAADAFQEFAAAVPADSMPPGLAIWAHGWLGINAALRGDLAEVGRMDEWLAVDRQPWGWGSFFRACLAAQIGRKDDAVALLRQAFSEGLHRNSWTPRHHQYPCFDSLRDYEPFHELIRPRG